MYEHLDVIFGLVQTQRTLTQGIVQSIRRKATVGRGPCVAGKAPSIRYVGPRHRRMGQIKAHVLPMEAFDCDEHDERA